MCRTLDLRFSYEEGHKKLKKQLCVSLGVPFFSYFSCVFLYFSAAHVDFFCLLAFLRPERKCYVFIIFHNRSLIFFNFHDFSLFFIICLCFSLLMWIWVCNSVWTWIWESD